MVKYAQKVLQVPAALSLIQDSRKLPQIPTSVIVKSALSMFMARVGSLNALEQLKQKSFVLREFIGAELPSADTIGRVFALIDPETIRRANHDIYTELKRNKSLELLAHGLIPCNFDAHESHATYQRHCDGCLERRISKGTENETIQYYHREVTAQLVFRNFSMMLDAEPQLPGEDEIACAIRLFKRIVINYPRAFDVVNADALYARSNFFNVVIESNKDVIAVLKDDRRDLLKDVQCSFDNKAPTCVFSRNGISVECWDESNFQSWPQVTQPVRVVRTRETKKPIRRQLHGEVRDQPVSSWTWVTTLSAQRAHTKAVVEIGHARWNIENQGFNESVNHYFTDHVYKHDPAAMLNFWLLHMMAYNIFHCFYLRNLKPIVRAKYTMLHIARTVQAELYASTERAAHPP
jgi:hypothetical protein